MTEEAINRSTRFPVELWLAIEKYAREAGVSPSEVIRVGAANQLKRQWGRIPPVAKTRRGRPPKVDTD